MKEFDFGFVETVSGGDDVIFESDAAQCVEIDRQTYMAVASKLVEAVGESGFFSGSVSVDTPEFYSTLTVSVIVYSEAVGTPEGVCERISDMVPVWWEFTTVLPEAGEILNDFSFGELRRFIPEVV